jgi:hypothetical protein
MITTDNFKQIAEELTTEQVNKALGNYNKDHISLEVFIFNAGHQIKLTARTYNRRTEKEHEDNGQLYMDTDSFLQMCEESGVENPAIKEFY